MNSLQFDFRDSRCGFSLLYPARVDSLAMASIRQAVEGNNLIAIEDGHLEKLLFEVFSEPGVIVHYDGKNGWLLEPVDTQGAQTFSGTLTAFLFFLFYDHQRAEALVGDLEERFPRMVRKFGYRKAWFWFWWQTLGSVGPIAWAWMRGQLNAIRKPLIAAVAWMIAHQWIGSDSWGALLAEVLKRVRG